MATLLSLSLLCISFLECVFAVLALACVLVGDIVVILEVSLTVPWVFHQSLIASDTHCDERFTDSLFVDISITTR